MTHHTSTATIHLPIAGQLSQGGQRSARCFLMSCQLLVKHRPTGDRPRSTLIHILDDDSLLNVFSFCRPVILYESKANSSQILGGGEWIQERWWYRLVQVCHRWRCLILEYPSLLRLSLVCARGTPVADMLAHSPPLPLIIDHLDQHYGITAKDEEGIIYALQHRDRVRRIRLVKPIPILEKLIITLDGEYPNLEYLLIEHQRCQRPVTWRNWNLNLPETFRAPQLRHIVLMNFAILFGSPLVTTMGNLRTLSLNSIPPSAYFHPNALLQRLSLMLQLETFGITFSSHFPSDDIERQLLRIPVTMPHVTLPNLRWFEFQGASTYLEALLPWVTIPLLERLQVHFFSQLSYSIPHLQQLLSTTGNLRLNTVKLAFHDDYIQVIAYPHKEATLFTLEVILDGRHLDWQVACTAQVFLTLRTKFSVVEHLTLGYTRHSISSEWNNEADRTHWRELLRSFRKVKTLRMHRALVKQLSRSLQPSEGELPTELLPELQGLSCSALWSELDSFTPFVDARRKAGRPVTVIRGWEMVRRQNHWAAMRGEPGRSFIA